MKEGFRKYVPHGRPRCWGLWARRRALKRGWWLRPPFPPPSRPRHLHPQPRCLLYCPCHPKRVKDILEKTESDKYVQVFEVWTTSYMHKPSRREFWLNIWYYHGNGTAHILQMIKMIEEEVGATHILYYWFYFTTNLSFLRLKRKQKLFTACPPVFNLPLKEPSAREVLHFRTLIPREKRGQVRGGKENMSQTDRDSSEHL